MLDLALSQGGLDDEAVKVLLSQKRAKIYQQDFQKALQAQIGAILDKLQADNYATIEEYLRRCYEDGYIGTMYSLAGQGIPLIMPINQAAIVKAILTDSQISQGLYTALGVNVLGLKKAITQEVSRGIASGLSYMDIARNISNSTGAPMSRTNTIARTEGHRIQQTAAYDAQLAAQSKGADMVKQWTAVTDSRTRESHMWLDGEVRELDEKFSNGLMYPGERSGRPEEVINCRCTLSSRARWGLDEGELEILKERAEFFGIDKSKNFEEFREKYLSATEGIKG